ncbi:MAG: methyltransferase domain-containing protein [Rhodocyclaceae bacterium]|jgi:ubiquinone/menaquinone biosynthesis C-methylase UbiE|nr:methyltransferase domain-containing protein [Rhodocyclaceae bacterium]
MSHGNWYERNVLPWLIDFACGMKSVSQQRMKVIPQARGRVLEIGLGTGLNLPFYDTGRVSELVGVEPSLTMHHLAMKRSRAAGIPVELVGIGAERLPLADHVFETVVSTYTLCTIPDPVLALRELRRVLAPGGRLLFSEHGKAPDESVRKWQARIQPVWGKFSGGCHLGRDIPAILKEAGFDAQVESMYIPGPRIASYHYWGMATAV